jgi:hypothetical protein
MEQLLRAGYLVLNPRPEAQRHAHKEPVIFCEIGTQVRRERGSNSRKIGRSHRPADGVDPTRASLTVS